jgi:hypothetical protein
MPGLLDAIFGTDEETVDRVKQHTGNDRRKAEQAYGAAAGTILRGLEAKTKTKEGAESIWDLLRKKVEEGKVPAEAPSQSGGGPQVREMDTNEVNDMLKVIFGKNAPKVERGYAKVVTLDPETSQKVFAKVLPAVLGGVFGQAERDPQESPKALPKVVKDARAEMEQRQPKAAGVFDAILDRDGDGDFDLDDLAGLFKSKPR